MKTDSTAPRSTFLQGFTNGSGYRKGISYAHFPWGVSEFLMSAFSGTLSNLNLIAVELVSLTVFALRPFHVETFLTLGFFSKISVF